MFCYTNQSHLCCSSCAVSVFPLYRLLWALSVYNSAVKNKGKKQPNLALNGLLTTEKECWLKSICKSTAFQVFKILCMNAYARMRMCVQVCVYIVNTEVNTNLLRMFSCTCLVWQMLLLFFMYTVLC